METSDPVLRSPVNAAAHNCAVRVSYSRAKRLFDICFSLLGLLAFAPIALLIALIIKVTSPGPVFFRQIRVGRAGRNFSILKFRTMVAGAEKRGPSVTKDRDPRITRIGRVLRRTKLDEFPQLWNVLRGDMSFVGPRPEVPRYVERYTPEQRGLLDYRPGITDLATLVFRDEEILLRNATDVEGFYVQHCIPRKFKLNVDYARRATLLGDIMIILETLCPYWIGVACGYALVLATSLWLAYLLRFDFQVPPEEFVHLKRLGLVIVPMQVLFLFRGRQISGLLSYFDVTEMKRLAFGLAQAALLQLLIWYITQGDYMPARSIILVDAALAFLLLTASRTGLRNLRYARQAILRSSGERADVLRVGIVGAGELGGWLVRQFNSLGHRRRRSVVVFFDDDPDKWNLQLCDVPVAGMPELLLNGGWQEKLDEVIVAMPSARMERQQQILSILSAAQIRARTLPSMDELFGNEP